MHRAGFARTTPKSVVTRSAFSCLPSCRPVVK